MTDLLLGNFLPEIEMLKAYNDDGAKRILEALKLLDEFVKKGKLCLSTVNNKRILKLGERGINPSGENAMATISSGMSDKEFAENNKDPEENNKDPKENYNLAIFSDKLKEICGLENIRLSSRYNVSDELRAAVLQSGEIKPFFTDINKKNRGNIVTFLGDDYAIGEGEDFGDNMSYRAALGDMENKNGIITYKYGAYRDYNRESFQAHPKNITVRQFEK